MQKFMLTDYTTNYVNTQINLPNIRVGIKNICVISPIWLKPLGFNQNVQAKIINFCKQCPGLGVFVSKINILAFILIFIY